MSKYEDYPIKSEIRDKLLADLAELALRGGKLQIENVEVEVSPAPTEEGIQE